MTITPIPTEANQEAQQYDLGAALASYSLQEGGIEPGDYDSYVGLIDRATLQRLNSPDDFFAEAKFPSDEYGDVVLGYYELGMEQLFAPCNNREAEVTYLNDALKYLEDCEKENKVLEDEKVGVLVRAELQMNYRRGETEWKGALADMQADHELRLDRIIREIKIDKAADVYEDYTAVRRRWQDAVVKKESVMGAAVGAIVQDMPYFFQEAVWLARRTESGSRRRHIQNLLARVTEDVSDLFSFRNAQRSLGGGRRGRGSSGPAQYGAGE